LRKFETSHIDSVILLNQAGRNTHEHICESLDLFAREVMPEFHARIPEQEEWKAKVLAREIDIPECVHDVIGGVYHLRTLSLEPGQSTQIPVSDGKKSVMAKIEAQQREDVKTPAGTFKAIRYEIYLFNNVLYSRSARLYVWLTDDRRKLPVQIRVRMPITVGTLTLLLEKYE